jgi:hypothetical protein
VDLPHRLAPHAAADVAWLKSLFAAAELITEAELETALHKRTIQPQQQSSRAAHLRRVA